MSSRSRRLDPDEKERRKEARQAEREQKRKEQQNQLWFIWRIIEDGVSNTIPDGDPIDWIRPRLERMGYESWDMHDILNKATVAFSNNKTYNDYVADMWDAYTETMNDTEGLDLYSLIDNPEELAGYSEKDDVLKAAGAKKDFENPWR
jgi:hypothetical protein